MLEEALVFIACVNGTGCSETSSLYFSEHPQIKKNLENDASYLRNYIGPTIVDTVGPALFVAAHGTGTIRLSTHFFLQFKSNEGKLFFKWDM